jgi:hypothetical protein
MQPIADRLDISKDVNVPVITVRVGNDAANEAMPRGGSQETLDALQCWLGPPRVAYRRIIFGSYDAAEGTAFGRTVATARILRAVPMFTQRVEVTWAALSPGQRADVTGYHPAMLAVLVDEAVTLRGINQRFAARARAESVSVAAREAAAREAIAQGSAVLSRTLRLTRRWVPAAYLARAPLPDTAEGVDDADALTISLDALFTWMTLWRSTWPDSDTREAYESVGFDEELPRTLRATSANVRESHDRLSVTDDVSQATERELVGQDGRVLHVMQLIHAAFAQAAEGDPTITVPVVDEVVGGIRTPLAWSVAPVVPVVDEAPGAAR